MIEEGPMGKVTEKSKERRKGVRVEHKRWWLVLSAVLILTPVFVEARLDDRRGARGEVRAPHKVDRRNTVIKDNKQININNRNVNVIQPVPRNRRYNNVVVVRPHGHAYHGYGHYNNDNDAWKWLAFTAITLKVLDNLNEEAQRDHEAAQVAATTAPVGESITWSSGSGSDASSGYVTATKEGVSDSGKTCREFQQSVTVGGKTEQAYGTACLQDDGSWEIAN